MPKQTYVKATEQKFERINAEEQTYLNGDSDTLPGAVRFINEEASIDSAADLFTEKYPVLFETNILRDEGDNDEKRTIMGDENVTILVRASHQRDGSHYVSGEMMEHEGDANRRRVYIRALLTDVLREVSEPLRSALDTLKASPVADLAPMAYDYLKDAAPSA